MNRFLIQSINWDEDGVVSVCFLDKAESLRLDGNMWKATTLSVGPEAGTWHETLMEVHEEILELLADAHVLYRDTAPFIPGETDDDENEDRGMGF